MRSMTASICPKYFQKKKRARNRSNTESRVDMVGTNHNKVLTQRRHMPMGQFRANIFLIQTTSTYFWASEVFKKSFKSQLFSSSHSPVANEL